MIPIPTQLKNLSALITKSNRVTGQQSYTKYDEDILHALVTLEQDLVTLPSSESIIETIPVVATAGLSGKIQYLLAQVLRLSVIKGYLIGDKQ